MKKLFLGSIILLMFSISSLILQISCTKNSLAQQSGSNGLEQLNKVLYVFIRKDDNGSGIWIANYDGSDPQELNIPLPQGLSPAGEAKLSPDGKTIFFTVADQNDYYSLYSGSLDGDNVANVTKIVDGSSAKDVEDMELYGAY